MQTPTHALSQTASPPVPHASLLQFVLNPLFQRRAAFVFREVEAFHTCRIHCWCCFQVLRLYRKSIVYYRVDAGEVTLVGFRLALRPSSQGRCVW